MRLYRELASWWPLLSPPSHYVEEAGALLPLLEPRPGRRPALLELGSGGGSLAAHLRGHFALTLTDLSPEMLAVSRMVHPNTEHLVADMRTADLGRRFERVLIHDAIMYLTTEPDLRAALVTARRHCEDDGVVVVVPDHVSETYAPSTEHGGEDGPDGRGLRYLEWSWDPDPSDTEAIEAFALMLREPDGSLRVELDEHRFGLFSRATWLRLFDEAGFDATSTIDPWDRDVFVARPRG